MVHQPMEHDMKHEYSNDMMQAAAEIAEATNDPFAVALGILVVFVWCVWRG